MVFERGPRWPVFVFRNAVNSRGSQFLLKACSASTFLQGKVKKCSAANLVLARQHKQQIF